MSFLKEFQEFAMRGNMMDMAVGVIVGGAFGKIVSSFVADIIMPPLGLLIGGVDFANLKITLKQAYVNAAGIAEPAVSLNYGTFINTIIDFLIIAVAIFLMIKAVNSFHREKATQPAPAVPTKEEVLLTEIRDLLKEKK